MTRIIDPYIEFHIDKLHPFQVRFDYVIGPSEYDYFKVLDNWCKEQHGEVNTFYHNIAGRFVYGFKTIEDAALFLLTWG